MKYFITYCLDQNITVNIVNTTKEANTYIKQFGGKLISKVDLKCFDSIYHKNKDEFLYVKKLEKKSVEELVNKLKFKSK